MHHRSWQGFFLQHEQPPEEEASARREEGREAENRDRQGNLPIRQEHRRASDRDNQRGDWISTVFLERDRGSRRRMESGLLGIQCKAAS